MSYMITTCPACGETYDFGVIGTTQIGSGHQCTVECWCMCGFDHRHCPCECSGQQCRYEPCDDCSKLAPGQNRPSTEGESS